MAEETSVCVSGVYGWCDAWRRCHTETGTASLPGCCAGCQFALQFLLRDAVDLHHFHPAGQSRHDAYARFRNAREFREERNARFIRFPVYRRRGHLQPVGILQAAGHARRFGARLHLHGNARSCVFFSHVTRALKFATPASARASTTSNANTSSNQSWLDPSVFCVATVSV